MHIQNLWVIGSEWKVWLWLRKSETNKTKTRHQNILCLYRNNRNSYLCLFLSAWRLISKPGACEAHYSMSLSLHYTPTTLLLFVFLFFCLSSPAFISSNVFCMKPLDVIHSNKVRSIRSLPLPISCQHKPLLLSETHCRLVGWLLWDKHQERFCL